MTTGGQIKGNHNVPTQQVKAFAGETLLEAYYEINLIKLRSLCAKLIDYSLVTVRAEG